MRENIGRKKRGGGNIDLLFYDALVLNYNDTFKRTLSFNSNLYNKKDFIFNLLKTKNLFWTIWAKVIKKDLYLKAFQSLNINEQIKINMAEDALLYYPLVCLANNIFYTDKTKYYFNNLNYNSITKNDMIKHQNLREIQLVNKILSDIKFKESNLALLNLMLYFLYIQQSKIEKEIFYKIKFKTLALTKIKKYLFKLYKIYYTLIK
ncbi:benzoate transporter [Campylobacter lari]|nr:benzoate transporter [Campylobacter lari]